MAILGTLFAAISCAAQTNVAVNNICYELKSDGAYVTKADPEGTSYSGDIVIPEEIMVEEQPYSVIGINANAFDGTINVTSITIPATVTTLGTNCIANLPSLSRLTFADGEAPISITGKSKSEAPIFKCAVEDVYIGRNFKMSTTVTLFATCEFKNLNFGKSIYVIPTNLITDRLSAKASGILTIPNGILEIQSKAFALNDIKHLVLPSSLRIFNNNMFTFDPEFDTDVVLESKAKEPAYFSSLSDLTASFGNSKFRFAKLIVPAGCKGYYEACNWTGMVEMVEEAEPEQGGDNPSDPEPPVQKAYVSLVHSQADGAVSYPRIETVQGGEFLLSVGVEKGWLVSSASFEPDTTTEPEPTEVPRYAEENTGSNAVTVEKIADSNRYNITIKNISGDGKLSYVVEKEIPTDVENPAADASKPRVKVIGGEIHVSSPKGCSAQLYDLDGVLHDSHRLGADSTVIFSGVDRGVYILKVGVHIFKVAL